MQITAALPTNSQGKSMVFGPCSAESYEQLANIVKQLHSFHPFVLRAGVWKPRTRPGHFQGMGLPALEWLSSIKKEFSVPVTTEVANADHVELALKHDIDILWIGARTTVNPFYVQDIADALKGTEVAVMIKNPLNPDLYLWLGAIERIAKSGISKITAIHRGFSFQGNSIYRNIPRWQIPIELRRQVPGLQMIADISHISGSPRHLSEIAQISFDLNYDGLMVEVHPDPSKALSDAEQQVTPAFLKDSILSRLKHRKIQIQDEAYNNRILDLRQSINSIDEQIINLISDRMSLVESIAKEKKQMEVSIFQPDRWDDIIERLLILGKENNLSEEFVISLIEAIHIESIQHQSQIMNQ